MWTFFEEKESFLTRSTRFTDFCTAPASKFHKKKEVVHFLKQLWEMNTSILLFSSNFPFSKFRVYQNVFNMFLSFWDSMLMKFCVGISRHFLENARIYRNCRNLATSSRKFRIISGIIHFQKMNTSTVIHTSSNSCIRVLSGTTPACARWSPAAPAASRWPCPGRRGLGRPACSRRPTLGG